MLLHNLKLVLN